MKKIIMVAFVEEENVDEVSKVVAELIIEKLKGKVDIQISEDSAPTAGAGATLGDL